MIRRIPFAIVAVALVTACTLERASAPPLAGPSASAIALQVTATPDIIPLDGSSSSLLEATARDPSGQPARGIMLHAEIFVSGVRMDYGSLSSRQIATNKDGRAAMTYYAPAVPASGAPDDVTVMVVMSMAGTNFAAASTRAVLIRLLRQGTVLPPNRPPVPEFFFSPTTPREGDTVTFDGSRSTDDGQVVGYAWSFGDGGAGSGVRTTHRYQVAGSYNVVLTVTDDRGARLSTMPVPIEVAAAADPVASFTISPTDALVGQLVSVNANGSKAAPGRTITSAVWDFGDGSAARTGLTSSHTYGTPGSFVVGLTVTDSTGRKGTANQTLVVKPK